MVGGRLRSSEVTEDRGLGLVREMPLRLDLRGWSHVGSLEGGPCGSVHVRGGTSNPMQTQMGVPELTRDKPMHDTDFSLGAPQGTL